jgi:CO dehydrogenase maturation factor
MPIRIAVAGKGGTGKTTLAALLCRSLVQTQGIKPLLAVDADPNSCLHERLGVSPEETIGELREQLRAEPDKIPAGISKTEWIERLINEEITEAVGFDLITMGRQEGPSCYCYINNLLRNCLNTIGEQYKAVVIDNEAGLEHLSRRSNGRVEALLVVCQPTVIGARTTMRILELIKSLDLDIGKTYLVLNGCDGEMPPHLAELFAATDLEVIAEIPTDSMVLDYEMESKSLLDLPADSTAAAAVDNMVSKLLEENQS